MGKNRKVNKLAEVFMWKEADEIVERYNEFREDAVFNPEMFNMLWNSLKSMSKDINVSWKEYVFNSFNRLIDICSREGTNNEKEKGKS